VHAGSVSKTLAPALRLGWLVVPERLAGELARAKAEDDLGTPIIEQLALADFLERGELNRHLRRTRLVYRRRRDAMIAALRRHPPTRGRAASPPGSTWSPTCRPTTTRRPSSRTLAPAGLGLQGLAEHRPLPGPPALLLGYGRIAEPGIEPGVRELAAAVGSRP
jgi:GntR family transcriptional regulator / MocR family aminotransferase